MAREKAEITHAHLHGYSKIQKIIAIPNLMRNPGEVYLDTDFRRYGKKRDLVPMLRGYPLRYEQGLFPEKCNECYVYQVTENGTQNRTGFELQRDGTKHAANAILNLWMRSFKF